MLQQKSSVANAIIDGEGIEDGDKISMTVDSLRSYLTNANV
jgi:hypothetical protein